MSNSNEMKNADRFLGFADVYENARPKLPTYPIEIVTRYLDKKPSLVVDLGCGTGLSTLAWADFSDKVIGIEPSEDMLKIAKNKTSENVEFLQGFSHNTGLLSESVDVVACSQSFHWMNPQETLKEVDRILKKSGIFITIDCDWPPAGCWQIEKAYQVLFDQVHKAEQENPKVKETFIRWDKNQHLKNIQESGYFEFAREIVFSNRERCDAKRFIGLAKSQGALQTILKLAPELIEKDFEEFCSVVDSSLVNSSQGNCSLKDREIDIDFSYRMRIAVK